MTAIVQEPIRSQRVNHITERFTCKLGQTGQPLTTIKQFLTTYKENYVYQLWPVLTENLEDFSYECNN